MVQILTHRLPGDRRQMTSGNNAGSQWDGSAVEQVFGQVILAGQHHGQPRFGVGLELGDGMQFGKDIEAQQLGLIDNQQGLLLFTGDQAVDLCSDQPGQYGP